MVPNKPVNTESILQRIGLPFVPADPRMGNNAGAAFYVEKFRRPNEG